MADRVYALFKNMETGATAVNEIITRGTPADRISVITHDPEEKYSKYVDVTDAVDAEDGTTFGAVVGALTGLGAATIPGLGLVVAGGPIAAALFAGVGAVAGAATGGITAGLVKIGVTEDDARNYEQVIKNGGAVVMIDTLTDEEEDRVENLLASFNPLALED